MRGAETGAQGGQGRGSMTTSLVTTQSNAMDHHVLLANENTETLRNACSLWHSVYPDCAPPWHKSEDLRVNQDLPDRTNIDRILNPTAAKYAFSSTAH